MQANYLSLNGPTGGLAHPEEQELLLGGCCSGDVRLRRVTVCVSLPCTSQPFGYEQVYDLNLCQVFRALKFFVLEIFSVEKIIS